MWAEYFCDVGYDDVVLWELTSCDGYEFWVPVRGLSASEYVRTLHENPLVRIAACLTLGQDVAVVDSVLGTHRPPGSLVDDFQSDRYAAYANWDLNGELSGWIGPVWNEYVRSGPAISAGLSFSGYWEGLPLLAGVWVAGFGASGLADGIGGGLRGGLRHSFGGDYGAHQLALIADIGLGSVDNQASFLPAASLHYDLVSRQGLGLGVDLTEAWDDYNFMKTELRVSLVARSVH